MLDPDPLLPKSLDWVARSIGQGARVESVRPLEGATSSSLFAVDVNLHERLLKLVLRLFTNRAWLAEEPDLARHEANSLIKVRAAGIPTPELIAFDSGGAECSVPALLMTRLPGSVDLQPADLRSWLAQQAQALLPLHAIDALDFPWHYAPYVDLASLKAPTWSRAPKLWEKAIDIASGTWPEAPTCFIHRDYHPVNVLFDHGRLSGIVDWVNACQGPAGFDLAWCRKNLASLYGVDAADLLLDAYLSLTGPNSDYHPFWDVMSIVETLPVPPGVYPPWAAFGVAHLSDRLMLEREEQYLASILSRL